MLNPELIGRTFTFDDDQAVTQAAIDAYKNVTGAPRFADSKQAAPMMAVVFGFGALAAPLFDPELKADLMRLVHGDQEMTWHAPFFADDTLRAHSRIAAIEQKRTGELLRIEVFCDNQKGQRVCDLKSGLFIRTPRPKGLHTKTVVAEDRDKLQRELIEFRKLPSLFEESITVGPETSRQYAEASGDFNPIHTDDEAAKIAGLPGVVLHGMCTMAFAHHATLRFKDTQPGAISSFKTRFARPVLLGDTLKIEGRSKGSDAELFVTNQHDIVVLSHGLATFA